MTGDSFDINAFHRDVLPGLIAANGHLALADLQSLGALGIQTTSGTYTYVPKADTIEIAEGDEAARTLMSMSDESFAGLVQDLESTPGLLYGGRAKAVRGNPMRFIRWEPALRAILHGLAIYDPESVDLRDLSGRSLDPAQSFTLQDLTERHDDVRHFFETVGYLHVRGVFDDAEIAALLDDAAALHELAQPGDQQSWWGKTGDGTPVLTRVLNAADKPGMRDLYRDERLLAIAAVPAVELEATLTDGRDAVAVLWKIPDVTEGLADLPWHRDCGMGGHALNCPAIVMTICLNTGSPEAGELRALPGSHRTSFPFIDGRDQAAPRGISLGVTGGDVTIHYTDVMHASMPPTSVTGPHRISVLLDFKAPNGGHHRGGRHYNDALLGAEDGQVTHLADSVGTR